MKDNGFNGFDGFDRVVLFLAMTFAIISTAFAMNAMLDIADIEDDLDALAAQVATETTTVISSIDPIDEFMGRTRLGLEETLESGNEIICVTRGELFEEGVRCMTFSGELRVWVCEPPFLDNLDHCVEKPKDEIANPLQPPSVENDGLTTRASTGSRTSVGAPAGAPILFEYTIYY